MGTVISRRKTAVSTALRMSTFRGAAKVMISQGDQPSVKVEGDENLLQYIEVEQEGDKIRIKKGQGSISSPAETYAYM